MSCYPLKKNQTRSQHRTAGDGPKPVQAIPLKTHCLLLQTEQDLRSFIQRTVL
jgi:hypothetical protein